MTDQDVAILIERTGNIQEDIKDIKDSLKLLPCRAHAEQISGLQLLILGETGIGKQLLALERDHNKLTNKVIALIGVLAGLGIIGSSAAGIFKLLGY